MPLRNRKTLETFEVDELGKAYKKEETAKPFFDRKISKPGLDSFKKDLQKRIASLPAEIQDKVLMKVDGVLSQFGHKLAKLFALPESQATLINSLSNIAESALKEIVTPTSKTSKITVPLLSISAAAHGLAPALALIAAASLVPAAAATAADLVINSGPPAGGTDLCSGIIFGCLQGYLTNGNHSWDFSMPQFSRNINQATSQSAEAAYLQLRDCITLDKMGDITIKALTATPPPTGALQTAAVATGIWNGYETSFQATSIPASATPAIEAADLALATSCQSLKGEVVELGKIIGGTVGAFVGLVIICAAGYYFKDKISECINGRTAERDSTPTAEMSAV